MSEQFAKRFFLGAGLYGIAVVFPLFFLEGVIAERAPPAITHAEFYYGFVCTALAWQFVYLLMARNPLRLRPVLPAAAFGKAGFAVAAFALCSQGRLPPENLVLPIIDLVLALLFIWVYVGLGRGEARGS